MPKPKGTRGGNKSPVQNAALKAKQFKRVDADSHPLDDRTTGIKLFATDGALVRAALPDSQARAAWLRRVIRDAAIAQLLPQQQQKAIQLFNQGWERKAIAEATGIALEILDSLLDAP